MPVKSAMRLVPPLVVGCTVVLAHAVCSTSVWRSTTRVRAPQSALAIPMRLAVAENGATALAIGKYPGWLYFVDGATGAIRWQYRSRGDYVRSLDITAAGDQIVFKDARALKPQTETTVEQMVMADSGGRVLWEREAPGAVRISPSGEYLLTSDRQNDFGIKVYSGSDGSLMWEAAEKELGGIEEASFSPDGEHILIHAAGKVLLLTAAGDPLWSMDFPEGVRSVSTSADGALTAVLLSGTSRRLIMVDKTGQAPAGMQLLRFEEFVPPSPERGDWDFVAVSPDACLVALLGHMPGICQLQAFDPYGNFLWDRVVPSGGGSWSFKILRDGLILLVVQTNTESTFYFVDGTGAVQQTLKIPGHLCDWSASPGGLFLSALVDDRVESFAVPIDLARAPKEAAVKLARPLSPDIWAFVPLRRSLSSENWSLAYNPSRKEVAASSADGKGRLRLKVGSERASVNGKPVTLPAPPRIVRGRVLIPSTFLVEVSRYQLAQPGGTAGAGG